MSGESQSHRSSDWTGCTGGIVEVEGRDEVEGAENGPQTSGSAGLAWPVSLGVPRAPAKEPIYVNLPPKSSGSCLTRQKRHETWQRRSPHHHKKMQATASSNERASSPNPSYNYSRMPRPMVVTHQVWYSTVPALLMQQQQGLRPGRQRTSHRIMCPPDRTIAPSQQCKQETDAKVTTVAADMRRKPKSPRLSTMSEAHTADGRAMPQSCP
jgi:hypothetical protein